MPTIRPIMFSPAMVRALLDGRKTQTRRMSTSPLRKCEPGDLLYVREAFCQPFAETPNNTGCIFRADGPEYLGLSRQKHQWGAEAKWTPAIHMPRRFSRCALLVRSVATDPLQSISEMDAQSEGLMRWELGGDQPVTWNWHPTPAVTFEDARAAFRALWESLHNKPGERWDDNPELVALTFDVIAKNVDRITQEDL